MNVASVLERRATSRGTDIALVEGGRAVTFAQLNDAAAEAACDLAAAGLRAGDRALVFCPMSIDLYVTLIAIFRIGAAAVFVDSSGGVRQIDACCERVQPRAFLAVRRAHLLRLVSGRIRRIPLKLAIGGRLPGARVICGSRRPGRARWPAEVCPPDAPALITFTSGSTGSPKAAARTHEFLLTQHAALAQELRLADGGVDLTTLPVFVLANLASGVTSVIPDVDVRMPGRANPARLLKRLLAANADRITASPALFERLVEYLTATERTLDIGRIFTGGAPVFPVLLDALAAVAPRASITAVYGSTEAEPIARLTRAEMTHEDRVRMRNGAGLLVGRPVETVEVRIVADRWGTPLGPYDAPAFQQAALPPEQPGEIVVSAPHVLIGYLDGQGDEETKIHVSDRVWHRTGDAGYLDATGRLWLLGRCGARISDARGAVYPFAVECAASDVSGVRRSALVPLAGKRTLVVELDAARRGCALEELWERLAWAHLDGIRVVDAIPVDRRHNAKVDYPALEQMLARRAFRCSVPLPASPP